MFSGYCPSLPTICGSGHASTSLQNWSLSGTYIVWFQFHFRSTKRNQIDSASAVWSLMFVLLWLFEYSWSTWFSLLGCGPLEWLHWKLRGWSANKRGSLHVRLRDSRIRPSLCWNRKTKSHTGLKLSNFIITLGLQWISLYSSLQPVKFLHWLPWIWGVWLVRLLFYLYHWNSRSTSWVSTMVLFELRSTRAKVTYQLSDKYWCVLFSWFSHNFLDWWFGSNPHIPPNRREWPMVFFWCWTSCWLCYWTKLQLEYCFLSFLQLRQNNSCILHRPYQYCYKWPISNNRQCRHCGMAHRSLEPLYQYVWGFSDSSSFL